MDEPLKTRLMSDFTLTEEQVGKLGAEGVTSEADLALLSAEQIKQASGSTLMAAIKIVKAFSLPVAAALPTSEPVPALDAEIPEGAKPSQQQVNNFATSLGMDPGTLSMMMMAGMASNSGTGGMDISSMVPVPQIVAGYSPKVRNMFFMIMGTLEARLGAPIVVINSDGSVNQPLTVEYIMGLEEGREPADNNIYFDSTSVPHEVIKVGVDAQSIYDADPLDSTHALQKNGMGIGRVNWNGTSLEVRQVAYYATSRTKEIDPTNDAHLTWLRDHVRPTATRLIFHGQAPRAIGEFSEASRTGSLPTLRVMLTRGPRKTETMPRRRSGTPRDLAGIGRPDGDL